MTNSNIPDPKKEQSPVTGIAVMDLLAEDDEWIDLDYLIREIRRAEEYGDIALLEDIYMTDAGAAWGEWDE